MRGPNPRSMISNYATNFGGTGPSFWGRDSLKEFSHWGTVRESPSFRAACTRCFVALGISRFLAANRPQESWMAHDCGACWLLVGVSYLVTVLPERPSRRRDVAQGYAMQRLCRMRQPGSLCSPRTRRATPCRSCWAAQHAGSQSEIAWPPGAD